MLRTRNQSKYRQALPQLDGEPYLTDGGLETTLIFHDGIDLPYFAAFVLLRDAHGRQVLRDYYRTYASIARSYGVGFILESATWRANEDWGQRLGCSSQELEEVNRQAIELLEEIRREYETGSEKIVISGCIGPRGDGYRPESMMTAAEAENYHRAQIHTFAETAADIVTALTITYAEEAIGIARAAKSAGLPVVPSFTVETDGRLPSGQTLQAAIEQVDEQTGSYPAYYMVNCAHPTHFQSVLSTGEPWAARIRGIRANASRLSHAELDEAEELDDGNPGELGIQYRQLLTASPYLNVLGGCCGTDHRHIEAICRACSL